MSIMLIRPMTPDTSHSGIVSIQYPINMGYLVSYLRKHNVTCTVRDFEVEPFIEDEFLKFIMQNSPLIIGFSCMTPHIMNAAKLANLVKKRYPGILTVVGGVHATAIPEQTLEEFPQFDVVVIGEGEITLLELYKKWTDAKEIKDILGIAYRDNSTIRVNSPRPMIGNVDEIPFPERDLVDIEYYKKSHVSRGFSRKVMKIAEVICSRGCPYNCIFCASKVTHGRRVRFRSAENIIAEIETLIKEYNVKHFSFLDDTFTIKKELLEPICKFMEAQKVTFDCFTRVNDINEEKMDVMMAGGCRKISFGIESGSPRVLKLLKKGITLVQIENAFRICKKARLPIIEATFMIGSHPDETLEDIKMTKKLIYKLRPDILGVFITIPYPGTELNHILKERRLLLRENWDEFKLFFGNPSWELGRISTKDLLKMLKTIVYGYYLSPRYFLPLIIKFIRYKEFKYFINLGLSFMKQRIRQKINLASNRGIK